MQILAVRLRRYFHVCGIENSFDSLPTLLVYLHNSSIHFPSSLRSNLVTQVTKNINVDSEIEQSPKNKYYYPSDDDEIFLYTNPRKGRY